MTISEDVHLLETWHSDLSDRYNTLRYHLSEKEREDSKMYLMRLLPEFISNLKRVAQENVADEESMNHNIDSLLNWLSKTEIILDNYRGFARA